jgi:hypothetical protein
MSRRLAALWLAVALGACVSVDDGRELDEPSGGMASVSGSGGVGGTGGGGTGGSGGGGGGSPDNPGGMGGSAHPALDVDAIFQNGCATASAEAELPQFNVLLVLDRSESMLCNPPPAQTSEQCELTPVPANPEEASKWEITRLALSAAIDMLPTQAVVGISYFSNGDECGVHSRPRIALRPRSAEQTAAIKASLASVVPGGATPLVGATILAYQHLHQAALAGELRGDSFVVLLTDGEQSEMCFDKPRCDNKESCTDLLVNEEVGKASGPGVNIRTFVIGVPGSGNARNVLSQIAVNGGTAREGCNVDAGECHFDMSTSEDAFAADLARALEQIVGRVRSCRLPLPPGTAAADRDSVNVVYSSSRGEPPRVIPRDDLAECEGANGWQYATDGKSVRLCGQACDDARDDPEGRIDVVLGCPVQGPQ